jgi:FkbM family methyltransferase
MSLFSLINKLLVSNLNKAKIIEVSSHYVLNEKINQNSLIFDLGANKGNFYGDMQQRFGGHYIAVEASLSLFQTLPKINNVEAYNYALGNTNGEVTFYLSSNNEANSMDENIAEVWGMEKRETVEGITLDNLIEKLDIQKQIDLIKVDIEGAEIAMLDSLSVQTLTKIAQITIEFHDFLNQDVVSVKRIVDKLKKNHFFTLKISNQDWREVLFINTKLINLNGNQFFRLAVIHPILQFLKGFHIFLGSKIRS